MNVDTINQLLSLGKISEPGMFPKLEELQSSGTFFKPQIGLESLPEEPGLITLRGPRQYGKSTWLEEQIKKTIESFGPGSAYYLNGDEIGDAEGLRQKLEVVIQSLQIIQWRTAT